jgi:hypothetical protein
MHPELARRFERFAAKMAEAGVPFALNSVLRTIEEQAAYYAQGRTTLENVNALRAKAGMYLLAAKENAYTVTKTMKSRHLPRPVTLPDGTVAQRSVAFDIKILRGDKTPTWDEKFDGDLDGIPDYEEAARIGEACGLVAGARWSFKDWPHFELPEDAQ